MDNTAQTLPRSFGFDFRQKAFQGTLINITQADSSVRTDCYIFWLEKEFHDLQSFFQEAQPTQEEREYILNTINKLIK